jgi:uncharacterized protein YejL (UPF0352 family)
MSSSKELNELLNTNFSKYKEEKQQQILKEQQELLNNYNKEIIPYNDLSKITLNNFYTNYFNNINDIITDLFYYKKWFGDGRLFYLGLTFIFIGLIYFIVTFFNYKKIEK